MKYSVFFLEMNQATAVSISIRFMQYFSLLNSCSTNYSLPIWQFYFLCYSKYTIILVGKQRRT